MNAKIIAIIPVYGRTKLLPFTISRLYTKNKLFKVICCGNLKEDKLVCESAGALWVEIPNRPLGRKWNAGFKLAETFDPDAILFVGSSDWISIDWIPRAYKYIENENYGMVGKNDFSMVDIKTNGNIKYNHWYGYQSDRSLEPIGIGRLVSRNFLKSINYLPFEPEKDNSMDYFMYKKCLEQNFKVKLLKNDSIFLSISTNAWINMHKFCYHWLGCLNYGSINLLLIQLYKDTILSFKKNDYDSIECNILICLFLISHMESFKSKINDWALYANGSQIHNIKQYENEFPEIQKFSEAIKHVTINKKDIFTLSNFNKRILNAYRIYFSGKFLEIFKVSITSELTKAGQCEDNIIVKNLHNIISKNYCVWGNHKILKHVFKTLEFYKALEDSYDNNTFNINVLKDNFKCILSIN